jgi:hypothetical protein
MMIRILLLTAIVSILLCSVRAAYADTVQCSDTMAIKADNAASNIGTWNDFYEAYKNYSVCDDGSIAEGFSDSAAKLFAYQWNTLDNFVALTKKDNTFELFSLKHLDETDDLSDLNQIASNAANKCPSSQHTLCKVIWFQAKYPDVGAWIQVYAHQQFTNNGSSVGYFPEYNRIVTGDLAGDGKNDLAVAFTLEGIRGGTDWLRYVAVFLKAPGDNNYEHKYCCMYQIGGKGIATDEDMEIKDHDIVISGKAFVEGKDALCCPSKPFTIHIKVIDGALVKVESK